MKNTLVRISFCLIILVLVCTCDKSWPVERPYPQIHTDAVSMITSNGARFTGTAVNASNEEIVQHGFIWGTDEYLSVQYSDKVLMGYMNQAGKFYYDVTFGLVAEKKYFVKAFIQTDNMTLYGNVIEFESLGSMAPVISGFEPLSTTRGDTITIYGEHFNYQKISVKVFFGNTEARDIIQCTENEISVIVPNALVEINTRLSVEVAGKSGTSAEYFQLIMAG